MRSSSNRILIVDDNEAIHTDFLKILDAHKPYSHARDLEEIEMALFDEEKQAVSQGNQFEYCIDSAFQGKDAVAMVGRAADEGDPYAMVFMDVRMPPGINGIETIELIWKNHPHIEMVIVTAFSDYSWEEILQRVGTTDRLMFLRKPFDQITVKQLALALTKKYNLSVKVRNYIEHFESEIHQRNQKLESMVEELKDMRLV